MARNEAIACDVCGRVKGETNHWWIALSDPDEPRHIAFAPAAEREEIAGDLNEEVAIEDICGADCAHKRLSQALNALPEKETHGPQTV